MVKTVKQMYAYAYNGQWLIDNHFDLIFETWNCKLILIYSKKICARCTVHDLFDLSISSLVSTSAPPKKKKKRKSFIEFFIVRYVLVR